MPSRLKGIETKVGDPSSEEMVGTSLNVPSRLKGIETSSLHHPRLQEQQKTSLNVPSRLKGIETIWYEVVYDLHIKKSECAFPFEGNRNVRSFVPVPHIPSISV